jgi:hypothetical protein
VLCAFLDALKTSRKVSFYSLSGGWSKEINHCLALKYQGFRCVLTTFLTFLFGRFHEFVSHYSLLAVRDFFTVKIHAVYFHAFDCSFTVKE